jgi:hypothetical protein
MNNTDNTKESVRQKVLASIEKENIKPKPKWHFFVHEWFIWFVAFLFLVLGSVATALTIYILNASRFTIRHIQFSKLNVIFEFVPFLWILLLIVGVAYTVYAIHKTNNGYKWHFSWLVGLSFVLSLFFGTFIYVSGFGEKMDSYLLSEMPYYGNLTNYHPRHWMSPENGIVAGIVVDIEDDTVFIRRFDGKDFNILITQETEINTTNNLQEGMRIRVIGTSSDESFFVAENIMDFQGRGGGMMRAYNLKF